MSKPIQNFLKASDCYDFTVRHFGALPIEIKIDCLEILISQLSVCLDGYKKELIYRKYKRENFLNQIPE
jgi:hypothetical protein